MARLPLYAGRARPLSGNTGETKNCSTPPLAHRSSRATRATGPSVTQGSPWTLFLPLGPLGVVAGHAQTHQRTPQGHGGPCRVSRVPLSVRCSHDKIAEITKSLGRPLKIVAN